MNAAQPVDPVRARSFDAFAPSFVSDLAAATGETAHACIFDPPESVTISIAEGEGPVGPRILVGARRPAHCCASGKLFLAYDRTGRTDTYIASALERWTGATLSNATELRKALEHVRRTGLAIDQGESYEGICGLAAPVRTFSGDVAGALAITVVNSRLSRARIGALAEPLVSGARRLSLTLGFIDPAIPRAPVA